MVCGLLWLNITLATLRTVCRMYRQLWPFCDGCLDGDSLRPEPQEILLAPLEGSCADPRSDNEFDSWYLTRKRKCPKAVNEAATHRTSWNIACCTVQFCRWDSSDMIFPNGNYLENEHLTITRQINHHLYAKKKKSDLIFGLWFSLDLWAAFEWQLMLKTHQVVLKYKP